MSVLNYGVPLSRTFAPFSSDLGSFWGSGSPDYPLSSTPTAFEAQALSSLFSVDSADIFHGASEGAQSRRREGGRKRKMSSREEPPREQPPKRRRETEPFPHQLQPQYVAPHELTTSPSEMHSYAPLPSPREPTGIRRQTLAGSSLDQRRPVEPAHSYSQSQYLQPPPESDWSRSMQQRLPERPVLPSISTTPGFPGSPHLDASVLSIDPISLSSRLTASRRPPTSYSVPSAHSGYAPAISQGPYDRHASYSYASAGYDSHQQHGSSRGPSHSPLPSGAEQSPHDSEDRPRPRCWEHGCNGKQFSTFSNLLRHQRERAGTSVKSYCPRCNAEFTRTTARNGHLAHAKCKPQRSPGPSGSGSDQQ